MAILGGLVTLAVFSNYAFEDAYITLRYGDNLGRGLGFTFQAGESVFGTSAPLWALLLGAGIGLGLDPEQAMDWGFAASLGWMAYAGGRLLQRRGLGRTGLCFALAILLGFARIPSYWGMETALFVALLLSACAALDHKRAGLAGLLLGLACLARYEGYGFALCLLAAEWARAGLRPFLRSALVSSLCWIPWLAFACLEFGSPIPRTALAKAGEQSSWSYLGGCLRRLPEELLLGGGRPVGLGVVLGLCLGAALGVRDCVRRGDWVWLALAAGSALTLAGLSILAPSPCFSWHRAPHLVVLLLFGLRGLGGGATLRLRMGRPPLWFLATAGLLVAGPLQAWSYWRLTHSHNYVARIVAYDEVAAFLEATGLNRRRLMLGEPGYLAVRSGVRVIDASGLVTEDPVPCSEGELGAALAQQPEMLLLRAPFQPQGYGVVFEGPMGIRLLLRRDVLLEEGSDLLRYRCGGSGSYPPLGRRRLPILAAYWGNEVAKGPSPGLPRALVDQGKPRALTAETELFELDAAALAVEFAGSHPEHSQVQLLVDGRVVRASGGQSPAACWTPGEKPEPVHWQVQGLRGQLARVRVLLLTGGGDRAAFGSVYAASDP